jgi:hypothetical protein
MSSMSVRELRRNVGRIPRLVYFIKMAEKNGKPEARINSLNDELQRRKYEMLAGGYDTLLDRLLKIKLDKYENKDSAVLVELLATIK